MNSWRAALLCVATIGLPLVASAQAVNTVFNDSFTADTLNTLPYPTVTAAKTGWETSSNKATPAAAESGGTLTLNAAGTTSGFTEFQGLFASSPVQLLPGTNIELTGTFIANNLLTTASDNLVVGLFNSGGSAPAIGLANSQLVNTLSNFSTGGAKGWLGYNGNIQFTGGTAKILTRPAQSAATNNVQDVLFDGQSSTVGYTGSATLASTSAASTTFVNGNTYTIDYKLALNANGTTLTATVSAYNGVGTTGTGANTLLKTYSGNATGANLLTTAFNAFGIGWRADAGTSNPASVKLSSWTVTTTGGAPWFTAQPPSSLLVTLGDTLNIPATAAGIITTYQWQQSTDGGSTYINLDPTANPSAATSILTLSNVQNSDAATYRLLVSNPAGSTASTSTTVTVSATPVPPSIITAPVGATVLGGTNYTFNVSVNGSSPLGYQWLFSTDGSSYAPISGANTATLALTPVSLANEGFYEVTISNTAGSATSAPAQLIVDQPAAITGQPNGAVLNVGDTFTIIAAAVGKPAPTYQWFLNGNPISGATNTTYTIGSAAAANAGIYTMTATSGSTTATTNGASVAVVSPTLALNSRSPVSTPTGVSPDTRLTLDFNQPVSVGTFGLVKIFDAANPSTPVDTIDLVAATALEHALGTLPVVQPLPVQNKTIGGVTNFNYYPITVSGNTATIYPRNNVLTYGHSYFVTIDPGVFTDSAGLDYAGITTSTGWTFSVEAVGPSSGATWIVVAPDGTGDFYTVQAALDFIPAANTTPRTIYIRKGTYFEQIYFTNKHSITFLGEDRAQSMIVYPNNNNFNNVSGTYHRMVLEADKANNITFANLTIQNTTPHGGSQAEALILNGNLSAHAIVTDVNLLGFQDTLQVNGQAYVVNSHISGDTDFMWGNGPAFFTNCELTNVTSASFFTQIRNGTGNHGFVYDNCTFDAASGVTGAFLGRIDPTVSSGFPNSEVAVLDSVVGTAANNAFLNTANGVSGSNYRAGWWLLNNAASAAAAPSVHNWANNLVDANGSPVTNPNTDAFTVMPTDATTQANYRNAVWVLNTNLAGTSFGSWVPQLAPIIAVQPAGQTVNSGAGFTLMVKALSVPPPTYQWTLNGSPIAGATNSAYTVSSAAAVDAGNYAVIVSNGTTSVTTTPVVLVVHGAPPVIALPPAATSGLLGGTATLDVWALGDTPLSYQWSKDGTPISGATNLSLRLTFLQASDAGNYSVAVSNADGTTLSNSVAVTTVTPATTLPTIPIIPAGMFDVTAYGAVGDGATDNTTAIQAAINAANTAGGGTVEIPPASASYLCGPITISSNTNFQIDGGATLQALPFGVYPRSTSAPSHFITVASGATNVEFSGSGVVEGDGAAWWAEFNSGAISNRPRMVQITKATNVEITGVTFQNSPNFHLAFSGANNQVTIYGVTISAPGNSPNTDGMDLAASNVLVQHCSVSDGDDNIVPKPGSVFCRNIYIADCTFGSGHGVSVGGQTNVGLDGMVVTNCTFNGTDTGLRLKADPTQGGPVTNVTYSNITMTNVNFPILFYSYYNQIGSPGGTSGSSQTTPAKVNAWNTNPPNSLNSTTLPTWSNITVSNLTATGATGYSTIWGLPLANGLVNTVTLNNVNITGGAGLELFDATNVQLTGTTNVGGYVTCNALGITGQPHGATINVGDTATFTVSAVGASGINNTPPTYQWALNGTPLTDGPQADGSVISGSTTPTLTITNARVYEAGNYTATVSNNLDGYVVGTNSLLPNSLPVSATSSAAVLVVNPLPATIALSNLTQTYDGTVKAPTVTTSPSGLAFQVTFAGGATPINANSYDFAATITDPNYTAPEADGTLVIQPAPATVSVPNVEVIYDGTAKSVAATTTPAGLSTQVTYNGDPNAPTTAGSYSVVANVADPNYTAPAATATLLIDQATPVVSWAPPAAITYGTALSGTQLNATANVPGAFTYAPGAGTVLNAGPNQPLSVSFAPTDSTDYTSASAATTITVNPAPATITLSNFNQTYDGTPKSVTATIAPTGVAFSVTYAGSPTAPTTAGSYAVSASVTDPNYAGSASGTLVIAKATPLLAWAKPAAITYGTALGATQLNASANVPGAFSYTPGAGTVLNAGANQLLSTSFTPTDTTDYTGAAATTTITVNQANATVTISDLSQPYDGTPRSVVVTTSPANLNVTVTYNGAAALPIYPGQYTVVATINEQNYSGTDTETLTISITALVRRVSGLSGGVDGSVQVTTPNSVTLNGNGWISGDLLAIGNPTLQLNGHPTFAGAIDGPGTVNTTAYSVTLNGNALLRHLVRRIDPLTLPAVPTPPQPTGARTVTLNRSSDSPGDFSTIRNLTLNGNVGTIAVPAGNYGQLIANGGSSFVLGHAGATTPDVYNLQGLTLNGSAQLEIAGPVLLVLANGMNVNGSIGDTNNPEWLTIAIANGGLTLNGNVKVAAFVIAPNGAVTINGGSTLTGEVTSDSLTINGSGALQEPK